MSVESEGDECVKNERPFKCPKCGSGYLYKRGMVYHMKLHCFAEKIQTQTPPSKVEPPPATASILCTKCGKLYTYKRGMDFHRREHCRPKESQNRSSLALTTPAHAKTGQGHCKPDLQTQRNNTSPNISDHAMYQLGRKCRPQRTNCVGQKERNLPFPPFKPRKYDRVCNYFPENSPQLNTPISVQFEGGHVKTPGMVDKRLTPMVDKGRTPSMVDKRRTPTVDKERTPMVDNGRTPSMVDKRHTPTVDKERTPMVDKGRTPSMVDKRHTPTVDKERTPTVDKERTPMVDKGRTPSMIDKRHTPTVDKERTPTVDKERTPMVDKGRTPSMVDKGRTPSIASTTREPPLMPKSIVKSEKSYLTTLYMERKKKQLSKSRTCVHCGMIFSSNQHLQLHTVYTNCRNKRLNVVIERL